MSINNRKLHQYCNQLKHFTNDELHYVQSKLQQQINNNITRTVQEEDLAFQKAVSYWYSYYQKLIAQNYNLTRADIHNWTFQQFRDFYEEHEDNWTIALFALIK